MATPVRSKIGTRGSFAPDVDFPVVNIEEWQFSGHLITLAELISGIKSLVNKKVSADSDALQVAKVVVQHWLYRNVYPISCNAVHRLLLREYEEFLRLRKLIQRTDRALTDDTIRRYQD